MKNKSAMKELLFNSMTEPIPGIRGDLDIIPVRENGDSYLYFHDSRGYIPPNFALDSGIRSILLLLNGRRSILEFEPYIGDEVSKEKLLGYIRFLDENRLLYSSFFKSYSNLVEAEYESSGLHESSTAGISYPSDPVKIRAFLDQVFDQHQPPTTPSDAGSIRALYAPHIDPRVGVKSYVQAFSPLRNAKPDRVVILATSHYASLYPDSYHNRPFVTTKKDFKLPLGTIRTDKKAVEQLLYSAQNAGLTDRDRAHRIEHSIELHLLFLSYLWEHEFSIVPILVQGFEELYYMNEGHLAGQIESLSTALQEAYGGDESTLFLISGDLSHVGRKFGDADPAKELFEEVKNFDGLFMQHATAGSETDLLNLMRRNYDPYRICGFPPLYLFLKTLPGLRGQQLSYDLWDETERESAVSFGSILYTD